MGEHTPTPWGSVEENDPDVLIAARAIAEHGIGRPWDDFLPVNVYDIDHGDLIEYGRAAVAALRAESRNRAMIDELVGALEHIAKLEPVVDQATGYLDDSAQQTAIHALQLARGSKGDE